VGLSERQQTLLEVAETLEHEARAAISVTTKRTLRRIAVQMRKKAEMPLDRVSGS
jgi:hypothetical protein